MWKNRKRQRDGIAGESNNDKGSAAVPLSLNDLMLENERLRQQLEEYQQASNSNNMQPLQITSPDNNTVRMDDNGSITEYVAFGGESSNRDGLMIQYDDVENANSPNNKTNNNSPPKEDFWNTLMIINISSVSLLVKTSRC